MAKANRSEKPDLRLFLGSEAHVECRRAGDTSFGQ